MFKFLLNVVIYSGIIAICNQCKNFEKPYLEFLCVFWPAVTLVSDLILTQKSPNYNVVPYMVTIIMVYMLQSAFVLPLKYYLNFFILVKSCWMLIWITQGWNIDMVTYYQWSLFWAQSQECYSIWFQKHLYFELHFLWHQVSLCTWSFKVKYHMLRNYCIDV